MAQCITGQKGVHQLYTLHNAAERVLASLGMTVPNLCQISLHHTNPTAEPMQLATLLARPRMPGQDASCARLPNIRRAISTTRCVAYDSMEDFMRLKRKAGANSTTYSDQHSRQDRQKAQDYKDAGWTLYMDNVVFQELRRTSHSKQYSNHSNTKAKDSRSHTTSYRNGHTQGMDGSYANSRERQHGSKQCHTSHTSWQASSSARHDSTVHRGRRGRTYKRSRWSSRPFSREWWQSYDPHYSHSSRHTRKRYGSFYSYQDDDADSDDDDFDWEQWVQQHLNVKPQSQKHTSSSSGSQASGRDRDWYRQYWEQPRWQDSTDSSSGATHNSHAGSHTNHSYNAYWWEHYKSSSGYGGAYNTRDSSSSSSSSSSSGFHHTSHSHPGGSTATHTPVVVAHLAALGLGPTTTLCAVALKKAFHKCAMQWHPDRHTSSSGVGVGAGSMQDVGSHDKTSQQYAAERFKAATAAYEALRALC